LKEDDIGQIMARERRRCEDEKGAFRRVEETAPKN
jgi:hypothetical protein